MVDASLVLDAIVAVSIAAGAFFAVLELRSMSRDRKTDLMLRCMEAFSTRDFENALEKMWNATATDAKGLEQEVSHIDLCLIADSIETLAFLAKRGLVDAQMLVDFFPFDGMWKKLRPWIIAVRERPGFADFFSDFEWLAKLQASQAV